jgi:peptidoglycan L-alanyl-D-glutamate endopeptidase CwlK
MTGAMTPRDRARLKGVHPDLVRVVERARQMVPFSVSEGVRTMARQKELQAQGVSQTLKSRHLTGHAVDLYPLSPGPDGAWTRDDFEAIYAAMKAAAAEFGVPVVHGHDWGWDSPHHELRWKEYPP